MVGGDQYEVEVGVGADLPACERAHRGQADAGVGNLERHGVHGLVPQCLKLAHRQIRAGHALGAAIAVDAVGIRLAQLEELLFQCAHRHVLISSHFVALVVPFACTPFLRKK